MHGETVKPKSTLWAERRIF